MSEIVVSVCMITYNHEPFIEKAIASVLHQQTNFQYELVIAEDNSSDATRALCEKYAALNPEVIRLRTAGDKNKGMSQNFLEAIEACKGKYIAFCEGDDYWTDPFKLQMQVDFLENHPECVLSCTRYEIFDYSRNTFVHDDIKLLNPNEKGRFFNLEEAFSNWITKTLTVVFRRDAFDLRVTSQYKLLRDTHLIFHVLSAGKGYLHNVFTGVYNIHDAGVWSPLSHERKALVTYNVFNELSAINQHSDVLRKSYLLSLRDYLNIKIHNCRNPLFAKEVYIFMWKYLREIHSFAFFKEYLLHVLKKQFS